MKMLSTLLSRFRREQPKPEKKPLTPKDGRAIVERALTETLGSGMRGFFFAFLDSAEAQESEIVVGLNGNIQPGLSKLLSMLLSVTDRKTEVVAAIISALRENGAQVLTSVPIDGPDDCMCPICTARREKEGTRQTTSKPH